MQNARRPGGRTGIGYEFPEALSPAHKQTAKLKRRMESIEEVLSELADTQLAANDRMAKLERRAGAIEKLMKKQIARKRSRRASAGQFRGVCSRKHDGRDRRHGIGMAWHGTAVRRLAIGTVAKASAAVNTMAKIHAMALGWRGVAVRRLAIGTLAATGLQ